MHADQDFRAMACRLIAIGTLCLIAFGDLTAAKAAARSETVDRPFQARQRLLNGQVILRSETALAQTWQANAEMSRACRRDLFRQRHDRHFLAVLAGHIYGAAVGGHSSLIDRVGLSQPNVVYIFRGQGSTNCRVYHRNS